MNAQQIKIISVNLSAIRNQPKKQVSKLLVSRKGVDGDGDTDYWNREISVLSKEAYTDLGEEYGFWGENITVEGMDLTQLKPMDCLISEEARLKVTITAHTVKSDSLIRFHQSGPKDIPIGGLFVRAQKEAVLQSGMVLKFKPKVIRIKILTLSDRASAGIYEDKSGALIEQMSTEFFTKTNRLFNIEKFIIPDEKTDLEQHLIRAFENKTDLLFTTGGTGIGKRDITPEVVKPHLDKEITGIMELIRVKYGMEKPNALISRSIAGVKDKTLVYCLPGSSKGVQEYLTEIFPTVYHSLYMLHDIQLH
ncbi:MAG: hypothetical protein IT220_02380 [Flavobacteriaceae bacterium]|nr:hypothetical protein [Flavobacteriaceae bacterium]